MRKRPGTALTCSFGLAMAVCVAQGLTAAEDAAKGSSTDPASHQAISAEEFLASPFAEFFQAEQYELALEALKPLLDQYPRDPLVVRYQAMTLDRLGRSNEAVAIFQELLRQSPNHTPTRFALAQTYARMGDGDQAAKAWRWVIENSPTAEYRQRAKARLAGAPEEAPVRKRWTLVGNFGWDWDSNVTIKPSDKALATAGDKNASRWSADLGLRYRLLEASNARVDLRYTSRQSLHDDSLDEFNFTSQEFGIDGRRRVDVAGRKVTLRGRYDLLGGFLDGDMFSLSNRVTASADTHLTPRTRTVVANRLTVSDFGRDGSNPPQTSRDGLYNDLNVTHYLYSKDFQRYVFVRQGYHVAWTRGGNFDGRQGASTRIGLHSPLLSRTDVDVSGGLRWNVYPNFTSLSSLDTTRRRDTNWDLAAGLTHQISPQVGVRLQYRWINALNRNDLFQYARHIVGTHLLFVERF